MLSSVYHKPPETFVTKLADLQTGGAGSDNDSEEESVEGSEEGSEDDMPSSGVIEGGHTFQEKEVEEGLDDEDMLNDLMGLGSTPAPPQGGAPAGSLQRTPSDDLIGDLMGGGGPPAPQQGGASTGAGALQVLIPPEKAGGFTLEGQFLREATPTPNPKQHPRASA
jgi:hypothetical protein